MIQPQTHDQLHSAMSAELEQKPENVRRKAQHQVTMQHRIPLRSDGGKMVRVQQHGGMAGWWFDDTSTTLAELVGNAVSIVFTME